MMNFENAEAFAPPKGITEKIRAFWYRHLGKILLVAEIIGTLCTIMAAMFFTLGQPTPNSFIILCFYTAGSASLLVSSLVRRAWWLVGLFMFLSIFNVIGFIKL